MLKILKIENGFLVTYTDKVERIFFCKDFDEVVKTITKFIG